MSTFTRGGVQTYYEVHGTGARVVCMGGWGTFCHGKARDAPRALADFETLFFDYRGLGESTDDLAQTPSMRLYADDLAALLDHLGWTDVHVVGMVGMGACVGQELAIGRPDLVRSLLMTGTWAWVDPVLRDMLELFPAVHRGLGFAEFQRMTAAYSFDGAFYNANRERLLGPAGAWGDLAGRLEAHERLVEACLSHDVRGRMDWIRCPSFVLHAGRDPITSERHTRELEAGIPGCRSETWPELGHVIAGKELKARFDRLIRDFLGSVP